MVQNRETSFLFWRIGNESAIQTWTVLMIWFKFSQFDYTKNIFVYKKNGNQNIIKYNEFWNNFPFLYNRILPKFLWCLQFKQDLLHFILWLNANRSLKYAFISITHTHTLFSLTWLLWDNFTSFAHNPTSTQLSPSLTLEQKSRSTFEHIFSRKQSELPRLNIYIF